MSIISFEFFIDIILPNPFGYLTCCPILSSYFDMIGSTLVIKNNSMG